MSVSLGAGDTDGMPQPLPPTDPATSREVVVGLVNDGMALSVAMRGVELAEALGASIRFVQVVSPALATMERAEAESATFAAGLKALRHGRHRGATFESPGGDPGQVLVARSAKAVGLVIGGDRPVGEASGGVQVADYCLSHARCPVHVVPRGEAPTFATEAELSAAAGPKPLGHSGSRS